MIIVAAKKTDGQIWQFFSELIHFSTWFNSIQFVHIVKNKLFVKNQKTLKIIIKVCCALSIR